MTPLLDSSRSSIDRLVALYKRSQDMLYNPNASSQDAHEYFNYIKDNPEEMQVLLLNRTLRIWHIRELYEQSINRLHVEPYLANKGIASIVNDWNMYLYQYSSPREHLEYLRLITNAYYQRTNPEELWNHTINSVEHVLQGPPITVKDVHSITKGCMDVYKQWLDFSIEGCYDAYAAKKAQEHNQLQHYRNDSKAWFQQLNMEWLLKESAQAISKLVREHNASAHSPLKEEWDVLAKELLKLHDQDNTKEQFMVLHIMLAMKPTLYAAMLLYGITDQYTEENYTKLKHMARTLLVREQQQENLASLFNEELDH